MGLEFLPFVFPTLVDEPPEGEDWIHEIKYDGYRTQIVIEDGRVRIYTRNGHDWTDKYVPIAAAALRLQVDCAIIDGEMIVTDEQGNPDFGSLRAAIRTDPGRLRFMAFDLLHYQDHDIRGLAAVERREILHDLIQPEHEPIRFSEHLAISGKEFYAAVDGMGLEGMVSKLADSTYGAGRTRSWLKTKCYEEHDFEVAGVLREPGEPPMVLMVTPDQERKYVGGAFIALNREMRERLWDRVQNGGGPAPKGIKKPKAEWVKPGLIGRVRHLRGEESLRHARLLEIREATAKAVRQRPAPSRDTP